MKVLHMMGGGDVGGAKTHIMSIITELRTRGYDVHLVSFRTGPFPEEAAARGVPVTVIEHMNPVRCRRELLTLIDEFAPDVIHCHGAKANLMGALARRARHIPVMTTVHSDYRLDYMGMPFKQATRGSLNAMSLRFLDFYQPVADRMARTLITRGFDPEKMVTIYNGMDFNGSVQGQDRAAYIANMWNVSVSPTDVCCALAARLTAVKDIGTAIKAFAKALQEAPQLRLFIAGDGEDEESLKKLTRHLGVQERITFCGWVGDIPHYFAAMDVNILSSLSETFPYSILEGVREYCATVSSDVGGMPDLITSGENGFIFQPGDADALAKYLVRLAKQPELRQSFAQALYEKAAQEFSLQCMCDMQIQNYERVLALFHRPKEERSGIVICGAYGKGNAGDDAILKAIVQEMREIDPTRPLWVMSRRPAETRLEYRTNAMYTFNMLKVLRRFRKSALYINGGGSLMQDVTSTRSLKYYLYTLRIAKNMGCRVMMYGCGIGPINRARNRKAATQAINKAVDLITLRDELSRGELVRMGITRPDVRLAADPTIILEPASREAVDLVLESMGIAPQQKYIGFGLRNWKGLDSVLDEIAGVANYAYETHGLIPLFVPIEYPNDLDPAARVAEKLRCPHHTIATRQPIEMTIGILSRMEVVIGIRLHSLVFSACHGVPVIGMSYDIKVDGFLKYIDSSTCVQLEDVRAENVFPLLDCCITGTLESEVKRMASLLRENERENTAGAKRLLALGTTK